MNDDIINYLCSTGKVCLSVSEQSIHMYMWNVGSTE